MSAKPPRLPIHSSLLTERQQEVLRLIARGRTNFEIATELGITLETVKYHVTEILTRLEVASREEAASIWRADHRTTSRLRALIPTFGARLGYAAAGVAGVAVAGVFAISLVSGGLRASNDDQTASASPSPTMTPASSSPIATVPIRSFGSLDPTPPDATLTPTVPRGTIVATMTPAPNITPTGGTTTPATSLALTPTLSPPASPSGPYPFGTRTGISAVDAVIAAAESGDYAQLAALITWHTTNCFSPATPAPYGAILCPADDPSVTTYEVASVEYVDGNMFKKDEALARRIGSALTDLPADQRRVYAIVDYTGVNTMVSGVRYRIVFQSGEAVTVNDTGIAQFACGRTSLACPGARTPEEQIRYSGGTPVYLLQPRP